MCRNIRLEGYGFGLGTQIHKANMRVIILYHVHLLSDIMCLFVHPYLRYVGLSKGQAQGLLLPYPRVGLTRLSQIPQWFALARPLPYPHRLSWAGLDQGRVGSKGFFFLTQSLTINLMLTNAICCW